MGEYFWIHPVGRKGLAVVLIGIVTWFAIPERGDKQFRRSQQALRSVQSWTYVVSTANNNVKRHEYSEVSCAAGQHTVTTFQSMEGKPGSSGSIEHLTANGANYVRSGGGDTPWHFTNYSNNSNNLGCWQLSMDMDTAPFPDFNNMLKYGTIERGEKKTVSGTVCQEWKVSMTRPGGSPEERSVCLGVSDHLPHEMVTAYGRTTYSDYNAPIRIERPLTVRASAD